MLELLMFASATLGTLGFLLGREGATQMDACLRRDLGEQIYLCTARRVIVPNDPVAETHEFFTAHERTHLRQHHVLWLILLNSCIGGCLACAIAYGGDWWYAYLGGWVVHTVTRIVQELLADRGAALSVPVYIPSWERDIRRICGASYRLNASHWAWFYGYPPLGWRAKWIGYWASRGA